MTSIHFLLSSGANIFHRNNMQYTALDIACERGLTKSVKALLSHALDCRARNVFGGAGFRKYLYTGLTTATEFEHEEVVKVFLDAGVDINMNINVDTGRLCQVFLILKIKLCMVLKCRRICMKIPKRNAALTNQIVKVRFNTYTNIHISI